MNTAEYVSTKMQQIALNAKRNPEVSFTSLAQHLDLAWLYEAYSETRKDGALGVDKVTAAAYAKDLKTNLQALIDRVKSGNYKAPPVRRVYIDKAGGKEKRPLGIPTFEEKVLQKAVKWLLEPIYEQEFYECSYGFRPNRSQHLALKELKSKLMEMGGAWIIDLDIRKYYDSIKWSYLCEILKQRVCDGVLIRLIGKWMNAGVMEEGIIHNPETGVPQGGVISPLLSNIFLHEILDKWFHQTVIPRLKGKAFEIRYADDALLCFESKEEAMKVYAVLPKRLEKYGLLMHPEKTKIVRFRRPGRKESKQQNKTKPEPLNFLGFTHYWRKTTKGNNAIARKTEKVRLKNALRKINEWCRINRHWKIEAQHKILVRKVTGHYAYYAITGNIKSISNFWHYVKGIWKKWLQRRSNRRDLYWDKMLKILAKYSLPRPKIIHSTV